MIKLAFVSVFVAFLGTSTMAVPANDANAYSIAKYGYNNKPVAQYPRYSNDNGRQLLVGSLWDIITDSSGQIFESLFTTSGPPVTFKPKPGFTECERECHKFVTSEYDPQCGEDGLTYTNTGKVECAKRCGKDVKLRRGACNNLI